MSLYIPRKSRPARRHARQAAAPAAAPAAPRVPAATVPSGSPATVLSGSPAESAPRLRDRYAFLNEPDCPVELHALVGHRITQYNLYTKLYAQLRQCQSLEECGDVSRRLIDAYLDNRQCTAELDYYLRHRRVLGRHPLMRQFRQLHDLRSKTTRQLFEERRRTEDNIWRAQSEIKKGDKPHLERQRQARIQAYQLKLQEIKRLLGE